MNRDRSNHRPLSSTRHRATEVGSVALATMLIMLMMAMTAVMVERSLSDTRRSRDGRDRAVALNAADYGVTMLSALVASQPDQRVDQRGTISGAEWAGVAEPAEDGSISVRVSGTANGKRRIVAATLRRSDGTGWLVSDWHETTVMPG